MQRKRLAQILACALIASTVFTGCSSGGSANANAPASAAPQASEAASTAASQSAASAAGNAATSASGKKYAIVVKSTGNPYNEKEIEGFKDVVSKLGATEIDKSPEQPTAEAQINMINQLVAQKVDGIAVAANDPDALQPALTKAMNAGVKVISFDSSVNKASRLTHVNQADPVAIGKALVDAAYDMTGGSGEFAILSATSQATNQNAWIAQMKTVLQDSKYANLKLDKIAYGDDLRDKSTTETEGLLKSYPNLKCIVSPTTVGVAAASKVLVDQGMSGKIKITGLGLPSEMASYIENGVCPYMYLWNPIDVGRLTAYTMDALVQGKIGGKVGDSFDAGDMGSKKVTQAADGGTEVLLGAPFKFDKSNIDQWKSVY